MADARKARVNVEGFRADVLASPDTLRDMAEAYAGGGSPLAQLPAERLAGRRLLFVGMGSSKYAADAVVSLLRGRGIDAFAELASAALPQPPSPDTVVFGISATGRTAETVEAMRRHLGTSLVVALTNQADGPVAAAADLVLPLLAGDEAGGIATKTYRATLAALWLVAGRLLHPGDMTPQVRRAADDQERLLGGREAWLPGLVELVDGGRGVWVAAPAERFASAAQSALMLREAPRIVAAACETGDWLHVDVYLTKRPGYVLLLLAGSRFDSEVMEWQRKRGFTVISVGRPAAAGAAMAVDLEAGSPLSSLVAEPSVAELLAAELWSRHPIE
jgi:glucosamine--fructose-6-phosphate aminotransferase (isomerizing)